MNSNWTTSGDVDTSLEDFAAGLTEAVYPIALRNSKNWLDLELELWRTLKKTVSQWAQEWPQAGVMLVSSFPQER
jgi:hypothetical protein